MIQNIEAENYWMDKLSGNLVKSCFPYDNKRINTNRDFSKVFKFQFHHDLFMKLMKLSNNSLPRLQMILTAGLAALLSKYSGNQDIIVGTTIYKQRIEAEFINTILPLRNQLHHHITFKELLLQVRETITGADENQNYPVEKLLQKLEIPYAADDDFPLFDIVILVENIQNRNYVRHINPNMLFSFLQTDDFVEGLIEYNSLLYTKETIERIVVHLKQFMHAALSNIDCPLAAIGILTGEEKKQLLEEFNDTRTEYPGDMTISRLFQQQARKTPHGTAVVYEDKQVTYKELNNRSDKQARILREKGIKAEMIAGIMSNRSIGLVTGILGILKAGAAFLPLDPGNPPTRIKFIMKDSNTPVLLIQEHLLNRDPLVRELYSHENIILVDDLDKPGIYREKLNHDLGGVCNPTNMAYIIYTSGTTGKPKGTVIQHRGLVNYISWAAKHYIARGHGDFPLFTSISFDLTVTSIFTPLITGNAIIVYEDGNEGKRTLIEKIIDEKRVDVVKLTPSHLKLVRDKKVKNPRITRFICGGEELETQLARDIVDNFGHTVEVINEYGPTEAVVGCMRHTFNYGEDTGKTVPLGIPADNVQIYILSASLHPTPLGVTGEMYISGDGIARGYLNRPELTAEKFFNKTLSSLPLAPRRTGRIKYALRERDQHGAAHEIPGATCREPGTKLYKTGDQARWITGNTIQFLGRTDRQLKIRGYRIEIEEIQRYVSGYPLVKESVVMAHEDNPGGKRLAAYVVPLQEPSHQLKNDLEHYLKENLSDYMIPAFIIFLKEIPLTPNGKIDSKKLSQLSPDTKAAYTPPRDDIEKKLVEIWSGNLGIPGAKIGIDTDYFRLGGHSLKATVLLTLIHKEFEVRLPLSEIFKCPTIKEMGKHIKEMVKENYEAIKPVEKKEYYPLSSAQKRLYPLQVMVKNSTAYNINSVWEIVGNIDKKVLEDVFLQLIQRHESFRVSFQLIGDEIIQRVHEEIMFKINYFETSGADLSKRIEGMLGPFDLSKPPLLRIGLIKTGKRHILVIDMHHVISDGISMEIFSGEFISLYAGEELPGLKLQYKDFSQWQSCAVRKKEIKEQEKYWLNEFNGEVSLLNITTDFPRPDNFSFAGGAVEFTLGKERTEALKTLVRKKHTTLFMVMLAALNILFSKICIQEDIVIGIPAAGRTHSDLERIVGFFINTLAIRNYPRGDKTFLEFLEEVRIRALEAFDNQDYQLDDLINTLGLKRYLNRNPLFDIVFAYDHENPKDEKARFEQISNLKINRCKYRHSIAKFDIHIAGSEQKEDIFFEFSYNTGLFTRETIETSIGYFKDILDSLLENEHTKLREISISHGMADATSKSFIDNISGFDF